MVMREYESEGPLTDTIISLIIIIGIVIIVFNYIGWVPGDTSNWYLLRFQYIQLRLTAPLLILLILQPTIRPTIKF